MGYGNPQIAQYALKVSESSDCCSWTPYRRRLYLCSENWRCCRFFSTCNHNIKGERQEEKRKKRKKKKRLTAQQVFFQGSHVLKKTKRGGVVGRWGGGRIAGRGLPATENQLTVTGGWLLVFHESHVFLKQK